MGAFDLDNNIDIDRERYNRENRLHPPEFPAGQDMDFSSSGLFSGGDDFSFDSPMSINSGAMQDAFDNSMGGFNNQMGGYGNQMGGFNGMSGNGLNMTPNYNQQQMQQQGLTYDQAIEMTKKTAKGIKQIFSSFAHVNPLYWYNTSIVLGTCGIVLSGLGVLTLLFGFSKAFNLLIAGLLSVGFGYGTSFIVKDKSLEYDNEYNVEIEAPLQPQMQPMPAYEPFEEPNWNMDYEQDFEPDDIEQEFEPEEDEPEEDEPEEWVLDTTPVVAQPISAAEALESLQDIPTGMYTRQYLYDAFIKMLPVMKPNFSELVKIPDDKDAFIQMESSLREAAEVVGVKESVDLIELKENFSTIILTCTRPVGFKPDSVADEVARIYAHRSNSDPSKVYAKVETIGRNCIITIFTGKTEMISLKDMMLQVQDFILDSKNYIPVVLGIDPKANVLVYDFKKLESIIITGMPRSGKSWFVQAVLTQMCAFVPPSELHIYICDPKDGISDFKSFCLPQVKKFVSGDANIVSTLRNVVKVEAPRRKKIIGDAGFVNIWDFKERYPDFDLPIIYVVIDEVVTLAERMEKETKQEFQGLLVELISQLPALGIRAFLIPHVIKNDIIAKTATDLVPCKISVCGDAEHIEKATGSKFKDFPYKLVNKGDMAVRMPAVSPSTMFIHGPALTESNPKNNDLFDYLRRVWSKLAPNDVENSVAQVQESAMNQQELMSSIEDADDLDIFDTHAEDNLSDETKQFRDIIIG